MKLHQRVLGGMTSASVSATLVLAACSGVDTPVNETAAGVAEEPIIAGVDAKSATLNAVGTLVEIYRYRYTTCAYGGSSGFGGTTGRAGMPSTVPVPIVAPTPIDSAQLRLDRRAPTWATAGMAGTPGSGGVPGKGGTPGSGGVPSKGGTPGSGGVPGKGGAPGSGGIPGSGGVPGGGGVPGKGGAPPIAGAAGTAGAAGCTTTEVVQYWPFCTATLIGPTAVQTAKHCLMDLDYLSSTEVGFAIGPDASSPTAVYPIIDWEWETTVAGDPYSLLSDLGSDVGVAHLSNPVAGVTPLAIGSVGAADVGKRFTVLGYGVQNNYEQDGTRKAGSLTFRGIGGNYADYAFGGLEGFLKAAQSMPQFQGLPDSYLTEIYYELGLLAEYQAFLGGRSGDAQPCYGDSGGPMIAMQNGLRTVFGNVTNGLRSNRLICDYGAVFAVFGPATRAFLQDALAWVDPCAGVSVSGYCDGDLAIRCTNRLEGKRRLSETDCGMLGQTCGLDSTHTVACVDPS